MWLPFEWAVLFAGLLAAVGFVLAPVRGRATSRVAAVAAVARESALLFGLYALWRLAGRLSVVHLDGAVGRGEWLWDIERALNMPDEAGWQAAILPFPWLVQAANVHYAGVHVPAMGIFLVWLFFAHRDRYPPIRNVLALLTGGCLLLQLLPVAPPRLVPSIDIVDTPLLYGQSVYSTMGDTVAGQLQAMPSLHAGWALLIAWAVIDVSTSRWRWWILAHPVATMYVIAVTGNHYWLDGVVAGGVLAAVIVAERRARELLVRLRTPVPPTPAPAERQLVGAAD